MPALIPGKIAFGSALLLLAIFVTGQSQAQTFTVLHSFTNGADGREPLGGLTLDSAGNLYGTTFLGGSRGANSGVVFKLTKGRGVSTFTTLYTFHGTYQFHHDGGNPEGRLILGADSTLYGTTSHGGDPSCGCAGPPFICLGCGTVFSLRPSANVCGSVPCPWIESQLLVFGEPGTYGFYPDGDLLFDQAQNIFGSAFGGAGGIVYQLAPSGGGWTESVVTQFGGSGGSGPDGLTFDSAGNIYGTTDSGGSGSCIGLVSCGLVFKLTPSNGSWIETILYTFAGTEDGGNPAAGVILDDSGNLYGSTAGFGVGGGGTVFKLSPASGGGWTYTVLHSFSGQQNFCGPAAPLALHNGSLYGTTYCDGTNNVGNIFQLTPSGGSWTYTSLHEFTMGADGAYPVSNVIFDSAGNLYGTASGGGFDGQSNGVVWEITP